MKKTLPKEVEALRVRSGQLATNEGTGLNGAFVVKRGKHTLIFCIVSNGHGWDAAGFAGKVWEHVSVSLKERTPTYEEMDYIKRLFWKDDETVMQLHVPRTDHINIHDNCLHLWRPKDGMIPLPPKGCV